MIRVSVCLYYILPYFFFKKILVTCHCTSVCRHMGAISVSCSWGVEQILDGGLRCRIEGTHTHMFSKNYRSYMHVYYMCMYIYIHMYVDMDVEIVGCE